MADPHAMLAIKMLDRAMSDYRGEFSHSSWRDKNKYRGQVSSWINSGGHVLWCDVAGICPDGFALEFARMKSRVRRKEAEEYARTRAPKRKRAN